jgi:predicted phosphate transport protein (TIGR00153 family)
MGIIPRQDIFFDLFEEQAEKFLKATELMEKLENGSFELKELSKTFKDLEHDCDEITHKIMERLNKVFLTPFDREDIHALAHELDEVVDFIEEALFKMQLYGLKSLDGHMVDLVRIIRDSLKEIASALNYLRKNRKEIKKILAICVHINTLENEGDRIMRGAMEKLIFQRDTLNPTTLLGLKEIYEALESTLDSCEDVANIMEGIILKNI